MTQRNENSVLFSLGHLQQMAMASAGNASFSSARPVSPMPRSSQSQLSQSQLPYVPVSLGPSVMLMTPKSSWPGWLGPAIIGMGTLFLVFLVLALAIAFRSPQTQLVARPVATPAVASLTPEGKPPAAPLPTKAPTTRQLPPVTEASKPAAADDATSSNAKVADTKVADTKVADSKKVKKNRTSKRRRAIRNKRRRRLARLRRRRRQARKKTRKVAARSSYRPHRKLGNSELDDLLSAASR